MGHDEPPDARLDRHRQRRREQQADEPVGVDQRDDQQHSQGRARTPGGQEVARDRPVEQDDHRDGDRSGPRSGGDPHRAAGQERGARGQGHAEERHQAQQAGGEGRQHRQRQPRQPEDHCQRQRRQHADRQLAAHVRADRPLDPAPDVARPGRCGAGTSDSQSRSSDSRLALQ